MWRHASGECGTFYVGPTDVNIQLTHHLTSLIHMEATLLRMLSLLRRTNVFRYNNITIIVNMSSSCWSYYFPDWFSTGPVIFPGPVYQPDLTAQTPKSSRPGSHRPRWPSASYYYDVRIWIYPDMAGIPELRRDSHFYKGPSGEVSIPRIRRQPRSPECPTQFKTQLYIYPRRTLLDSEDAPTGLPSAQIRYFRNGPIIPRIY